MRIAALAVLTLLLAGCTSSTQPPTDPGAEAPAAGRTAFKGIYRCPGDQETRGAPCDESPQPWLTHSILDGALHADGRTVAFVGSTLVNGNAVAAAGDDAGMAVFTSSDGIAWSTSPLPPFPDPSTRLGYRTAADAQVQFLGDRLYVVASLLGNAERNLIGGNVVPDPLQGQNNVGVVSSPDLGATWDVPLFLSEGSDGHYPALHAPDGGPLVATWWTALDGFHAAWTWDGQSWSTTQTGTACRVTTDMFVEEGHLLFACLARTSTFDDAESVLWMNLDLQASRFAPARKLGAGAQSCGTASLQRATNATFHLLVGGCTEARLLWSEDALNWTTVRVLTHEDLGPDRWGSYAIDVGDAAIDGRGWLHSLFWAHRLYDKASTGCTCIESQLMHLALDPGTGGIVHQRVLHDAAYEAGGLARTHLSGATWLESSGDTLWMEWPAAQQMLGQFVLDA